MFCNNIKYTLGLLQCRLPIPQLTGSFCIRNKKNISKNAQNSFIGHERRHERQEGENERKVGEDGKKGKEGEEENV